MTKMEVIDSHTAGEPTRVVLAGWPQPEGDSMLERCNYMKKNQDNIRRGVVCEPKGHEAMVGALLTPPIHEGSQSGVIFFNSQGYLGMCGHALIGTVETLRFLNKIENGLVRLDTPAGTVQASVDKDGQISLANVKSYLYKKDVEVEVPGLGFVVGDVAYGGNWFFLTESVQEGLELDNIDVLMSSSKAIRKALADAGITGDNNQVIDHVELYGTPKNKSANSRNFVLCPGNAYDRSPCGTGTSAKMAVLHAKGQLAVGEKWNQESITNSVFEGYLEQTNGSVVPIIRSKAHITSTSTLYFDPKDPICWGITA